MDFVISENKMNFEFYPTDLWLLRLAEEWNWAKKLDFKEWKLYADEILGFKFTKKWLDGNSKNIS